MKKIVYTAVLLSIGVSLNASPVLFETYQKEQIIVPQTDHTPRTALELQFSVDTSCYVQFSTGGLATFFWIWLDLNGDSLPPVLRVVGNDDPVPISYSYLLEKGSYTVSLKIAGFAGTGYQQILKSAYLQALIFLPDSASASVSETHEPKVPSSAGRSIISRGPYVSAPGASSVVDAAGRVMENVLSEGKVQISNLPAGTYYAKDEERTVVKIVKVD